MHEQVSTMKDDLNVEDDGLMFASRFYEKLHVILKVQNNHEDLSNSCRAEAKTFDVIRPLFSMIDEQAASFCYVHSSMPVKWRGLFTVASARGETKTVHLGDGLDRILAHAWNEPG